MKSSQQFSLKSKQHSTGQLCWGCCWNLHAPRKSGSSVIFSWRGRSVWHIWPVALSSDSETPAGFWLYLFEVCMLFPQYKWLCISDISCTRSLVHNNKWRDLQSVFSVTCKQVFCILTFLEMKKAQLASYHLIWLLFNPPFPIVSVFSNFVSKTYFLCPCHMHTHLDVLCAMLCFMLC